MNKRSFFLAMASLVVPAILSARVALPTHFTSNMVLQQQSSLLIKGQARPNSTVDLQTSWSRTPVSVMADGQGRFEMRIATPKASLKPHTLTFSDGEETTLENVLIGEVWLGSGQSNMEMPVEGWGKVFNYEEEIANANYPMIRLLQVKKKTSISPLEQVELNMGGWQECSPQFIPNFSALCYFYALRLWEELKVPIGVIDDDWGGTVAEAWVSAESLEQVNGFESQIGKYRELGFNRGAIEEYYVQQAADFEANLRRMDKGFCGPTPWTALELDDDGWKAVPVPGIWEDVLGSIDGIVWYRLIVDLPKDWAGKELTLDLGVTDDQDVTFWNGEEVGRTTSMNEQSTYKVPAKMVKEGRNVIAVRVMDTGGNGGLSTSDKGRFSLKQDGKTIALAGQKWMAQAGVSLDKMPPTPLPLDNPNHPTVLFNAMIHPLISFPVRGIIWYQGCSNVGRGKQYEPLFQTLIHDWRRQFGNPQMPFYFVQLANYLTPKDLQPDSQWAQLRESQAKALCLPNTGMAVNIDLGDARDIHPKTKRELGRRLAAIALHNTYGKVKTAFTAPVYKGFEVKNDKIHVYFSLPEGSEPLVQENNLSGFIIQGPDLKWHVAEAQTVNEAEVVVSSPEVRYPVAVRYGWADNPTCTLRTQSNFHVAPFRTDY